MWKQYVELPRPVHILCLGTFINRAGTLVVPFITVYLHEQLGLSIEFATRAIGAYGLGAALAVLMGGHLADRIGRRIVMLGSLLGSAAILLFISTLTSPWALLAGMLSFSLVAEMYRPAASAMIADLVEPERRAWAYSLMYVSVNLGFSVGPVVAGLLAKHSFQWLFWGDALTTTIYAAIILFVIHETLPRTHAATQAAGRSSTPSVAPGAAEAQPVGGFRDVLRDRVFMTFCLGNACLGLVYMQHISTFPLYLQSLEFGPEIYGRLIAINGVMIVCLQLPITALMANFNRALVLVLGAALTAVGFGLTGRAETVWQFAGTIVIWTLGEIAQAPNVSTIVTDLAPTPLRARYFGVLSVSFSGANMLGAPLGGLVLAHLGGAVLWNTTFYLALLGAVLFFTLHGRIGRRGPREATTAGA